METETFKLILLTVPHTFRMELVRIICFNIKTFILGFLFLHSRHLNVRTINDTTSDSELQSSDSKDEPDDSEDDAQ